MTARHARPLGAYLCTALAAALLLVQSISVPRDVPGVSGVIGGVSSLDLGVHVVLSPLHGQDEVAAVGRAVPQRVAEERSVFRAATPAAPRRVAPASAAPAAPAPAPAAPVRPRDTSASQSGVPSQSGPKAHSPKPAPTAGAKPRVDQPGKVRVTGKGQTRGTTGSARSSTGGSPRADRASHAGQHAKGHGRPAGKPAKR